MRTTRTARRASDVVIITLLLVCARAAADEPPSPHALDASSSWADLLAADLTTCAETQCTSVDDRACASTCDASRTAPPVCREVDCGSCLDAAGECEGPSCGERVCVLCAWPGEGDDVSAVCHASSASPAGAAKGPRSDGEASLVTGALEPAAMAQQAPAPRWALYEVKDHRYRLLTAGFLGGPLRPAAAELPRPELPAATTPGIRERIGQMGMLALIHSSRERGDDPVAHLFSTGGTFEESVRSSLESTSIERARDAVVHTSFDSGPAVHDVREALLERTLFPVIERKGASSITARLEEAQLIDIDGSVDDARAERALLRSRDAFQLCYESAFKAEAAPSGKLAVEFDIDASGRVVDVFLAEDELDSDPLSACVLSTVERLRLPAHEEEATSFRATLSFRRIP